MVLESGRQVRKAAPLSVTSTEQLHNIINRAKTDRWRITTSDPYASALRVTATHLWTEHTNGTTTSRKKTPRHGSVDTVCDLGVVENKRDDTPLFNPGAPLTPKQIIYSRLQKLQLIAHPGDAVCLCATPPRQPQPKIHYRTHLSRLIIPSYYSRLPCVIAIATVRVDGTGKRSRIALPTVVTCTRTILC